MPENGIDEIPSSKGVYMIAIIDCCGSNFASIKYAFEKLGQEIVLTHDAEVIKKSDCVILPGARTC
ncbi:hypothetical protein ACP8HZ_03700 [Francisella noatunensis]